MDLNQQIAQKHKELHTWWLRGEEKQYRARKEKLTDRRDFALAEYTEACEELKRLDEHKERSPIEVARLRKEVADLKGQLFIEQKSNLIERLKELTAEKDALERALQNPIIAQAIGVADSVSDSSAPSGSDSGDTASTETV